MTKHSPLNKDVITK